VALHLSAGPSVNRLMQQGKKPLIAGQREKFASRRLRFAPFVVFCRRQENASRRWLFAAFYR
jgi:hypothetical protein